MSSASLPSLEPARASDLPAVLTLVEAAGLPVSGLLDAFPAGFVVARAGGALVGVSGLEPHGAYGLLRSVTVAPAHRRGGLGRRLVEDRLEAARARGMEEVYLLTTGAAAFFRGLGFVEAARDEAPAELRASTEFAECCPRSAACLARRP